MTYSIDQTLHQFANLLPNWTLLPILTLFPNFGGFHRTLQRVRLANRGTEDAYSSEHLVLSHLGLAFVLMLRPFFPELVMSTDFLSFEHPSVLLFCLLNGNGNGANNNTKLHTCLTNRLPFIKRKKNPTTTKTPIYITKEILVRFEPQKVHLNDHCHNGRNHWATYIHEK